MALKHFFRIVGVAALIAVGFGCATGRDPEMHRAPANVLPHCNLEVQVTAPKDAVRLLQLGEIIVNRSSERPFIGPYVDKKIERDASFYDERDGLNAIQAHYHFSSDKCAKEAILFRVEFMAPDNLSGIDVRITVQNRTKPGFTTLAAQDVFSFPDFDKAEEIILLALRQAIEHSNQRN